MWMLFDDLFGDLVVGLHFQPSLSLLDASQPTFRAASAFLLQAFAQSCIMVRPVSDPFPWMKCCLARRSRSDRQIANADIHPNDFIELLVCWLRYVN